MDEYTEQLLLSQRHHAQKEEVVFTLFPSETWITSFEKQMASTPSHIAVKYEEQSLTYRQLNEKANQLAHFLLNNYPNLLCKKGASNILIGLCLLPSIDLLIGLLSISKIGAIYVPIDPENPAYRIQQIVSDSKLQLILTLGDLRSLFEKAERGPTVLVIDQKMLYDHEPNDNLAIKVMPDDLAYIIYTSGSTGKPKGVMISHRSVNHYIQWMASFNLFHSRHIVDCSLPIAFDASVQVLILPLCIGATVSLCSITVKKSPAAYLAYLHAQNITVTKLTPSYLSALITHLENKEEKTLPLQILIVGGEKFSLNNAKFWKNTYPNCAMLHHYGPTEATVGTLCHRIDFEKNHYINELFLGKNSPYVQCYIVDEQGNCITVPGEIGELYISGVSLAKGYLNEPELTKKYFIPNPFTAEETYAVCYKTGDMVKHLPDGNFIFMGRKDNQIKIRGYRIESGEIESVIGEYPGIAACHIVLKKFNEKEFLTAYYTTSTAEKVSWLSLRNYMIERLPSYMIPAYFVEVATFPLNINGKLDKNALPLPNFKQRFAFAVEKTP